MGLMRRLFAVIGKKKMKEIEHLLSHPIENMDLHLQLLLRRNEDTVYGRRNGFGDIRTPEEFSGVVPLSTYDTMKPYLDRVNESPKGKVMTEEPVVWYLQTSGSSGAPKQIPVTPSGLKDAAKGGAAMWLSYMTHKPENSAILDGTMILFAAPSVIDEINGIPVGYGTGVYARHQNRVFRRLIAPGEDILNITDMEQKMRAYALEATQCDVTALQGIATLSLAFVRKMERDYGPWLEEQLRGTKHHGKVKKALADDGTLDVSALWPNLRLLVVGGIDTDPYREWIKKTFPDITIWEAYASSEGFYASQTLPEPGVQILPDLNYLEFIPKSEIDKTVPDVIPLADVKKGSRYEIVVTNMNGWYRYRLGDMVTISRTDPYTLRSIGRKGKVVNLAGEKLTETHVSNGVAEACRLTGAELMDYSVVAEVREGIPHYKIAAMFREDNVDSSEFIHVFEEAVSKVNWEFANSRGCGGLGPTKLLVLRSSAHEDLVSKSHLQAKPVPLTTNTDVLELCEEEAS
ncbi:MAG: GH3 family domain-containing protein [Candidatus Thorarchaeota archaeon]|jgi:phenylacetate-coenzyme A ligase PaaK-like adenylate-forming protein